MSLTVVASPAVASAAAAAAAAAVVIIHRKQNGRSRRHNCENVISSAYILFFKNEPAASGKLALWWLQRPFRRPFLRRRSRPLRRHDAAAGANDDKHEPHDGWYDGRYVWRLRRHGHDGPGPSHADQRLDTPQQAATSSAPPFFRPHCRRARLRTCRCSFLLSRWR